MMEGILWLHHATDYEVHEGLVQFEYGISLKKFCQEHRNEVYLRQ